MCVVVIGYNVGSLSGSVGNPPFTPESSTSKFVMFKELSNLPLPTPSIGLLVK